MYKVDIMVVQDVRWKGQSILEMKDCTVYYSCHKRLQQFSAGFIINMKPSDMVTDFQPINIRKHT
jgi:hypothetical protein